MPALSAADCGRVPELVAEALRCLSPEFPDGIVTRFLRDIFHAEFAGATRIDLRGTANRRWPDSPSPIPMDPGGFHCYAASHPLTRVCQRPGEPVPLRLSDIASPGPPRLSICSTVAAGRREVMACFLGRHRGEWEYEGADSCHQVRVCERCGENSHRGPVHQPGQWGFMEEHFCDQVRICQRCRQEVKRRTAHDFGPWEPNDSGSGGNCDIICICQRCYAVGRMTVHEYHWEYVGDSCKQVYVCIGCKFQSPAFPEIMRHAWDNWKLNQAGGYALAFG
jgi:hypothetical protein